MGKLIQSISSESKPKSGKPTVLPKGYIVGVNKRSGLPYLKKKK